MKEGRREEESNGKRKEKKKGGGVDGRGKKFEKCVGKRDSDWKEVEEG